MRSGIGICSILVIGALVSSTPVRTQSLQKLDSVLQQRAAFPIGYSRVLVQPLNAVVDLLIQQGGGSLGRALPLVNARAANVPDTSLALLAASSAVERVALDRVTFGFMERTAATVGATAVRQQLSYDGHGVGVALIDSGITPSHDDLADPSIPGSQRVVRFVDFVNNQTLPYDDYGHGTHVAGIVAGNGADSSGRRAGIAPAASLVVLKVLDGSGSGRISDVIAALDYVIAKKDLLNIRVVNLSVGTGVYESYTTDYLTLAAKRAVDQGIVVVAAAGNLGRNSQGQTRYGGITAPGNAPWVLTVGASSHMGTSVRDDDTIAAFSSRGPTAVDYAAKPDLVAPGVGIESLTEPSSLLYSRFSNYLLNGTVPKPYFPYLSLTGTSMAAPVVTGTVALMLQANPGLTPNAVKAILQYTAQTYPGYDALTEGAGFLNALGAVELARFFSDPSTLPYPSSAEWNGYILWGNHRISGGRLMPGVTAWALDAAWGSATTSSGEHVAWGTICSTSNCDVGGGGVWVPWQTSCADSSCQSVAWGGGDSANVVWGSQCGGSDCSGTTWAANDNDTVVWGSSDFDTVVWGSSGDDTVVWGSSCGYGGCDSVIWK
jgi:serine protease AprX